MASSPPPAPPSRGDGPTKKSVNGSSEPIPARSVAEILEELVGDVRELNTQLYRVADAAEEIEGHLEKWDRDGVLYTTNPVDGVSTVPALESISWRLYELGSVLNVTPDDIARLGLAHPGPADLEPVERALERVALTLDTLVAEHREKKRPPKRRVPNPPPAVAEPSAAARAEAARLRGGS